MIIVCDIGASNTRVAGYANGVLSVPFSRSTPSLFSDGYTLLTSLIRSVGVKDITGIVGGIRGSLARDASRIADDDVLLNWVGKPIGHLLEEEFGVPVILERPEVLAARGFRAHVMGIGIISFINIGATVSSATADDQGFYVHTDDEIFRTLSRLVGGLALEKRTGEHPYNIHSNHDVWREAADYVAQGIASLIHTQHPETIVLGGKMITGSPCIPLADILHAVHRLVDEPPTIILCPHGDESVLFGAARHALVG